MSAVLDQLQVKASVLLTRVSVFVQYEEGQEGVWRTVRGRRVFIREGEDLDSALGRSLGTIRTPAHVNVDETGYGLYDKKSNSYAGVSDSEWDDWTHYSEEINLAREGKLKDGTMSSMGERLAEGSVTEFKDIGERIQAAAEANYVVGNFAQFRGESFDTMAEAKAIYKHNAMITLNRLTGTTNDIGIATMYASGGGGAPGMLLNEGRVKVLLAFQQRGGLQGIQTAPLGVPSNEIIFPKGAKFRVVGVRPAGKNSLVVELYNKNEPTGQKVVDKFAKPDTYGGLPGLVAHAGKQADFSILATADADGHVYVEWDESKHPRDKEGQWTTSGVFHDSLGIDRKDMPQITAKYKDEFFQFAKDKGVSITSEQVSISSLKPTQKHFNPVQVLQLPQASLDYPLMVSSDNRVLDGTNRYVRILKDTPDKKVSVYRIGLKTRASLAFMRTFPKVGSKDITFTGPTKILAVADAMGRVYAEWDESKHPRAKTTPGSRGGSFAPAGEPDPYKAEVDVIVKRALADPVVIDAQQRNNEFGDVRERLGLIDKDGNYTVEGMMLKDRIADSFITQDTASVPWEAPVATIMLGRPGSGKSTTLNFLSDPIPKSVVINPDLVMESIPEYIPSLAPSYHVLASDIVTQDLLPKAAMGRYNLVLDMTGKDPNKMERIVGSLKALEYKVNVVWADAPGPVAVQRVYDRLLSQRRYVPMYVATQDYSGVSKSFESLKSSVDNWSKYDTSGKAPKLIQSGSRAPTIGERLRVWLGGQSGEIGEEEGGRREEDVAERRAGALFRSELSIGGEGQEVDYAEWDESKHPREPAGSDRGGEFTSSFSSAGDETGLGMVKKGDSFVVFRLGSGRGLVNANAGNANAVALHLVRMQDLDAPQGVLPHGELITAYQVTLTEDPGRYMRMNARIPGAGGKEGARVGREQTGSGIAYSFPEGSRSTTSALSSVALSDVMAHLKSKYGYADFDSAGGNIGAKAIRDVFRERLTKHAEWDESKHQRHPKGQVDGGKFAASDSSLRDYLSTMVGLRGNPPEGFEYGGVHDFILKNGRAFQSPTSLPSDVRQRKLGLCFMNAYQLVDGRPDLTYVEGIASYKGIPIDHAWAVDKDNHVIDPTWAGNKDYLPGDHKYFGVKIPIETVRKTIFVRGKYGVLYNPEQGFPLLKEKFKKFGLKSYSIERPLYVSRPVENADEIIQWAKSVGFETTLPAEDMHVTICYSKEPVDWLALDHWADMLEVPPEGVRMLAEEDGVWRTINGMHVFIRKGESPTEAINRQLKEEKEELVSDEKDVIGVVDSEGISKRIYYRGQPSGIKLKPNVAGLIAFTPLQSSAEHHQGISGQLWKVKLSSRNPYVTKTVSEFDDLMSPSSLSDVKKLKRQGYDSVVARDGNSIGVFSPKQVKLVALINKFEQNTYADRTIIDLGDDGAVVLRFDSQPLQARHQYFLDHGVSWDYDAYHPHITLTYDKPEGLDLSKIEPYTGRIVLGPEQFAELETGWAEDIKEHVEQSNTTTDYTQIKRDLDSMEAKFKDDLRDVLIESRDALLATVKRNKGELPRDFKLPHTKDIQGVIGTALQRAMDRGGADASKEIGKAKKEVKQHSIREYAKVPTFTPKAALKWLREKIFWVADVLITGLEEDIRSVIINGLKTGKPTSEIITDIAQKYIPYLGDPTAVKDGELPTAARLETVVRTNTTEAYNQGRIATFVRPDMMPFLDGIRYSAILDTRTTPVCRYLHERIFKPEDIQATGLVPPNHFQCRSLVVPVVVGEISHAPDFKVDPKVYITDEEILHAQALADAKFLEQCDDDVHGYHTPGGHGHDQQMHAGDNDLNAAAKAIHEMDPDKRDNTEIGDFPGHAAGYNLYEAQKMLPKPSDKLKKVTDNNSFALWRDYHYIANVEGNYFGITKEEDPDEPDDESKFIFSFKRLDQHGFKMTDTITDNVQELFQEMRKHKYAQDDKGHDGVWRTVRGRKVFIREGETPTEAVKRAIATRTERSLQSHIPATKERQLKAAQYEETVAKLIGGKNLEDHEPFDVIKGQHAVEVKTLVSGKNSKVTMHPESLTRKTNFLRKEKMTGHTVVIDARGDKPVYHYKAGVGSFRLSSMQQVKAVELKGLIT